MTHDHIFCPYLLQLVIVRCCLGKETVTIVVQQSNCSFANERVCTSNLARLPHLALPTSCMTSWDLFLQDNILLLPLQPDWGKCGPAWMRIPARCMARQKAWFMRPAFFLLQLCQSSRFHFRSILTRYDRSVYVYVMCVCQSRTPATSST